MFWEWRELTLLTPRALLLCFDEMVWSKRAAALHCLEACGIFTPIAPACGSGHLLGREKGSYYLPDSFFFSDIV